MCGVFGIHAPGRDVARLAYFALYALQHRGQESAGIAVSDGRRVLTVRDMGLVAQVFDEGKLQALPGRAAIGHARYSTTGSAHWMNSQPIVRAPAGPHRRARPQRQPHEHQRAARRAAGAGRAPRRRRRTPRSSARSSRTTPARSPRAPCTRWSASRGAFSAVVLSEDTLLAFRDPDGIRPLVLGDLDGSPVVASETPALDIIGATVVRELQARRAADLRLAGLSASSRPCAPRRRETMCVFEHIYFARPDAQMDGQTLHAERERMGERLAVEAPVDADVVIPVPDSGTPAAQGYARASGLPFARRPDQEPLRRAHVHPARPGAARARRAPQVQPAAARHRGQAAGRRRRLDRARLDHAQDRADAARRRRARGAPAHLGAADHLALLLRHRHGRARTS